MIHKTTRSILSVLLAALLLVTSTPLTPAFAGDGGVSLQSESAESRALEPAADGVYQIATANDLREFAQRVNNGELADANAVLTANIDLNNQPWYPIGTNSNKYTGNFNGDGHTISGLYIDSSANYQGLFGYVSGTVQNLTVSGSVSGNNYVGGVVGYNGGTVENCYNTGTVTGNNFVGGIVGDNYPGASVKNCYNTGSVSGNSNISNVGGVVGYNSASVTNCYNTGEVSGNNHVGGVVGWNISSGNVTNCYNTGAVSGGEYVGGVVGQNNVSGIVTGCYNTGSVTGPDSGSDSNVGGVVGYNVGSVTGCYFLQGTAGSGIGNDKPSEENVKSLTAEEFADQSKFSSWTDFTNTWKIEPIFGRPTLKANAEIGGTANNPYKIFTATQLKTFRDLVNGANNQPADPAAHAVLMNDIDLKDVCGKDAGESEEEVSWGPIGTSSSNSYRGTFDGNGHKIENLYINTTDSGAENQGLFGFVGTGGTVQNLNVSGSVSVSHGENVGGIVGYNFSGTVTNCAFSGSVGGIFSGSYVGGIVGYNSSGTVTNCAFSGSVSGNYVGGVVGYNNGGTVTGCIFSGSGSVSGGSYVGGVVGWNSSDVNVTNCYNIGSVSGSASYVGGVVGYNQSGSSVTTCYNTGKVTGGWYVGGVVGYNSGSSTVTGCYFLQTETVNTKLQGIGENDGSGVATATEKDDTAFHSGEVAWRLQNGQTEDQTTPVWGQNIKDGKKDNYPQLRAFDADTPQVYKVAFMNDSEEHDAKYANSGMTVTIPAAPSREGHTFTGWSDGTSTYQAGAKVEITSDTKFTAQWTKDTVNYTVTVTASPAEGGTVNGGGTFTENDSVTVTATANDGYTFVAWQEGGTKIENAGASYTFTVNDNRSLTAIFEKEPEPTPDPTPTPTPDPTPSGPSTGDSSGWDDIRDELENAANGDEITIDMGDETKVPAEIFESLAGKDVEISFDLGDVQWTVNGADIPTDTDFTDLDLGASLGTSGIPVNVINAITGEVGTVQITLAHDGEFGFTMTLTAPLGKENAGYWANLYHYDEDAEALNFEAAAKIDETGNVTIPFSHASQYAIVIDTHSHATVDVSDLFIDIAPDAWYKDAVQYAYDNGLMTGVSDTEFAPEATTTRAMIVSILARLENVTTAEAAGFADVTDEWYATAVNWAANVGVVNGYEDNTFKPNTAITREQLAAILMNYASYKGYDVSARADLSHYSDADSISSWANDVLLWAVAEGLLTGVTDDTIAPQAHATRAQVAAILQRFLSE